MPHTFTIDCLTGKYDVEVLDDDTIVFVDDEIMDAERAAEALGIGNSFCVELHERLFHHAKTRQKKLDELLRVAARTSKVTVAT